MRALEPISKTSVERDRAGRGGSRRTPGGQRAAHLLCATSEHRTYAWRRPSRDGRSGRWSPRWGRLGALLAAACGKGGESAKGAVGAAIAAAVRGGLDASAAGRAPWRCGALDGPAPAPAAFTAGGTTW